MLAQRRLLRGLMRYAAGAPVEDCLTVGVHKDADGSPILYVPTMPAPQEKLAVDRYLTCEWLHLASTSHDALLATLAPEIRCELFSPIPRRRGPRGRPRTWHSCLVLRTDRTITSWATAVLALACCTPTGEDDCLANRIAHCAECGTYFILPTSRPSRTCSADCRKAHRRKTP